MMRNSTKCYGWAVFNLFTAALNYWNTVTFWKATWAVMLHGCFVVFLLFCAYISFRTGRKLRRRGE